MVPPLPGGVGVGEQNCSRAGQSGLLAPKWGPKARARGRPSIIGEAAGRTGTIASPTHSRSSLGWGRPPRRNRAAVVVVVATTAVQAATALLVVTAAILVVAAAVVVLAAAVVAAAYASTKQGLLSQESPENNSSLELPPARAPFAGAELGRVRLA